MASNNPNDNRGNLGSDRSRGNDQKQEVSLLAKKFNVSEADVERAMQQAGNDRTKLEELLRNKRRQ